MIKAISCVSKTFLFCVVFEWEVFERSYYKSFCSYHFRNMRFENPVPFLCKSVISGVTTYGRTVVVVQTGCKGSWQMCCFIVQRRGGKNRNVHVFPFTFYCFSLLGFLFRQFDHLYFESNSITSITSRSNCSSNKLIFVFQLRAIHERD